MTKVSICIPAYKQTVYLQKCLDSVFVQDHADYEVIVSDDTPDDTVKDFIEKNYTQKGIKYFKNPIALGTPENWNNAISKASGEYIKLLHHDDFFTRKDSLSKLCDLLDKYKNAAFSFSASLVWTIKTNNKRIYSCTDKQLQRLKADPDFLFFKNVIGSPSATLFRKTQFEYDKNLKWLVDLDHYRTVLRSSNEVVMCDEALICTADGAPGQVTQSVVGDKEIQVNEHVLLFEKILNSAIDEKKYILFFDELFVKYGVKTINDLKAVCQLSSIAEKFFNTVFDQLYDKRMYKAWRNWFYGSRFNNQLFHLEKY